MLEKHHYPSLYEKKTSEIPLLGIFLAKNEFFCQFWFMFTENPLFESGHD